MSRTRPLGRFAAWRFAIEEEAPTPLVRLRRMLWDHFKERGIDRPIRIKWYGDLLLEMVLGNDQSRCLYVGGSFEPNEFAFLDKVLRPGMVVVDAGANEGFYSVFMARRVGAQGRVIAVEPSPRERARLVRNIEINGFRNVEVRSTGLGAGPGQAVLHIANAEHNGQNTLGSFVYEGVSEETRLQIALESIDAISQQMGDDRIDVIKMDVEGSELRVLEGATRVLERDQPLILFEVLDKALRAQGASAEQLIAFLYRRGFVVLQFGTDGALYPLSRLAEASSNLVAAPPARAAELSAPTLG